MALTPTEEARTRQLIAKNPELLNLADNQGRIISELGTDDISMAELPVTTVAAASDLLLARSGADDKTMTVQAIVNEAIDQAKAAVADKGSTAVAEALRYDWLYRDVKIDMDLFYPSWTMLDDLSNVVTSATDGSNLINLDNIDGLKPGREYVIFGNGIVETVTIDALLTSTTARLTAPMVNSFTDALIRRSNWQILDGRAVAVDNGVYLAGPLNMGPYDKDKAVIIRRDDSDGEVNLYFKDAAHTSWTRVYWEWDRTIGTGTHEREYEVPARGVFEIKIESNRGASRIDPVVYHIVSVEHSTGLDGSHHPPERPVNAVPVNGATGVQDGPTVSVAAFTHVLGELQGGLQVQVSVYQNFSTIFHDSGVQSPGISYSVPAGLLTAGGTYYWRVRVKDIFDAWSDWSVPTSFTCSPVFTYVVTPKNVAPIDGALDIAEQPSLSASVFSVYNGTDTHAASQWRVRISDTGWSSPVYDSGETADLLSHNVPAGYIQDGTKTYFWQVRYKGASLGWSDWSQETTFTTRDVFADIVGIALLSHGGGAGRWQVIDKDGNDIAPGISYFNNHPVFGGIRDVVIDGQDMVEIPKFYVKSVQLTGGDQAGSLCWMVSDAPVTGFTLHPAFMDAGSEISAFYIGKYEATFDLSSGSERVGSKKNEDVMASRTISRMKDECEARNTGGVSGFHMVNIFEIAAIQVLCLIENGGPDVQSTIGEGNVNSSSKVKSGESDAVWRGICELWGNTRCMIDGINFDQYKQPSVFDLNGNSTYVNTHTIFGTTNGWVYTMSRVHSDDFDFRFLFISESTTHDSNNGTYGDYSNGPVSGDTHWYLHGGGYSDGKRAGLFSQVLSYYETVSEKYIGSRLAKI